MTIVKKCPECGADVEIMCEHARSAWVLSDGSGMSCSGGQECPGCGHELYWQATVAIRQEDVETE